MAAANMFTDDVLAAVRTVLDQKEEEVQAGGKATSFAESGLCPTAAAFGDAEFLQSPALTLLAADIIDEFPEFEDLQNIRITYDFKKKGGRTGGADKIGQCTKASGLLAAHGDAQFYIWLAADHVAGYAFDFDQVRAALYHELAHIRYQEKDGAEAGDEPDGEWRIVAHDFEGFTGEMERYGLWRSDLRRMVQTTSNLKQSGLPGFGAAE
jgi:hypothetical protein